MPNIDEVQEALLERLKTKIEGNGHHREILNLSEALAWLIHPNQPHGSSGSGKPS